MEENTELDSEFDAEEIPSPSDLWNYMEHYWHNNREFPENTEDLLKRKADLIEGKVPSSQLPNYVNDILEFESLENLPNPGEKGKIYIITQNNTQFRWSGSEYIQLNSEEYLMTTDTNQSIYATKYFNTEPGNNWYNNKLVVYSAGVANPGMSFYKEGVDSAQLKFNGNWFYLTNSDGSISKPLLASAFIKDGSDNNHVLLGGGGHKAVSDFATSTELGNYVTIATPQEIEARKIFRPGTGNSYDTASLEVRGSNASGIFPTISFHQPGSYAGTISMRNSTQFQFRNTDDSDFVYLYGAGFIKTGSDDNYILLGGGGHTNLDKFIFGTNETGTINGWSLDWGLPTNSFKPSKSGFYRPNNENAYGSLLMWVAHPYTISGEYGAGIALDYAGTEAYLTGIDGAGNKTPNKRIWTSGNFDPGNYLTNRGNWHNALLAKTDFSNSVTEYADDPSITGFKTTWGTSLHIKGNGPWYNRLDFNTNGRLDWWKGINTTDMTYMGQITVIPDGVENWTSVNFNPNNYWNKYSYGGYIGINTNDDFAILNNDQAQRLLTNGLLVSNNYTDRQYIPNQGIFSTGTIATSLTGSSDLWYNAYNNGLVNRGRVFQSNVDANNLGNQQSAIISIELGNGTGNTNFPVNNAYGTFMKMSAQSFTSEFFHQNAGELWHRNWYFGGDPNDYQFRKIWDNVNFNPDTKVNKSGDTMTGALKINTSSGHLVLSESNINKWYIESVGGEFIISEIGVAQRFKILPGASTPTYNGYGLWHAGNFNPDTKVNKSGDTMTGNLTVPKLVLSSNDIHSQTLNGTQVLSALIDKIYIGNGALDYLIFESKNELTHYMNGVAGTIWTTHNFNPDTKVNALENATGIGFSSGVYPPDNGSEYPYIYHGNSGSNTPYVALATQEFVNYKLANYQPSIPVATNNIVGGIRLISDTKNNVAPQAVTTVTDRSYAIQLNNNNQAVVNVPWIDPTILGYATQSWVDNVLTDYAHKADANTFTKVNTFDLSPRVPAGVNGSDAVNVAQLFEVASTQALDTVNSKFITEITNTSFAAFDMSGMGYPTILTVIAKLNGELRVEEVKDGRSVKVRNVSSGNLEVRINGGTTTIVSANTWADYHSDGSGDITMTSQAGCYII